MTRTNHADRTIGEFLDAVASTAITPSGGAVIAITGAGGAALCEMACIHTLASDEGADDRSELSALRPDLEACRTRLLELAANDSRAVEAVHGGADRSDRGGTEPDRDAAKHATEVPLETAQRCRDVLEHAVIVTDAGVGNALADAGTGAYLAHAAARAGVLTVRANLPTIDDPAFVTDVRARADATLDAAEHALERTEANLDSRL